MASSRLARLRSCGERARRHEPLQKRKRTSSSELWPRPSARTGTSCERRRQPRAPVARALLSRPSARAARPPRDAAGEDCGAGPGGVGDGWGVCGSGRRDLPLHKRAVRIPGKRLSHPRCPVPAPPLPRPLALSPTGEGAGRGRQDGRRVFAGGGAVGRRVQRGLRDTTQQDQCGQGGPQGRLRREVEGNLVGCGGGSSGRGYLWLR